MRFGRAVQAWVGLVLAVPMAVGAHPGHVHHPGLVHGTSWIELFEFVVLVAVPLVIVFYCARVANSR